MNSSKFEIIEKIPVPIVYGLNFSLEDYFEENKNDFFYGVDIFLKSDRWEKSPQLIKNPKLNLRLGELVLDCNVVLIKNDCNSSECIDFITLNDGLNPNLHGLISFWKEKRRSTAPVNILKKNHNRIIGFDLECNLPFVASSQSEKIPFLMRGNDGWYFGVENYFNIWEANACFIYFE